LGALSQQFYNQTVLPLSVSNSKSEIGIFPNPANESFSIRIPEPLSNFNLQILDLTGKEIKSFYNLNNDTKIETSELNCGLYLLKLETKDFKKAYTISIQH
jgi:hypothetical protein